MYSIHLAPLKIILTISEQAFLLTRKTETLSHLISLSIIEVSLFFYFVGLKFKMTAYLHALFRAVLMEFCIDMNFKKMCDDMIEGIGHICKPINCLVELV